MKKKIKKVISLTAALMMVLSLTACGGDMEEADESGCPAGFYPMATVSLNGETVTYEQIAANSEEPPELYIAFNEDGTGELQVSINGEAPRPFVEEDGVLYFEASEDYGEMAMEYTFDGTTVTIDEGEDAGIFTFTQE